MKSVLMSIQPKWCELIASGKKTIEVRKTKPKLETPFKCYIYCTKPTQRFRMSSVFYSFNDNLIRNETDGTITMDDGLLYCAKEIPHTYLNGYVIGEFVCNFVDYIRNYGDAVDAYDCKASCLSADEIIEYAKDKNGNFVYTYGWHISDLVIYDKPRELSEFWRSCGDDPKCEGCEAHYFSNTECGREEYCCSSVYGCRPITRPPQSWCYVEELK